MISSTSTAPMLLPVVDLICSLPRTTHLGDDARAGLIADITDLGMSKLGDYAPLSVEGMQVDGKLYGIPESLKAVAFLVR